MSTIEQIYNNAVDLPEDQLIALIHRLLMIGEPSKSKNIEKAWDFEIRDRIERYDKGQTSSRLVGEVFSKLDKQLK